jgi:hypothetical protein
MEPLMKVFEKLSSKEAASNELKKNLNYSNQIGSLLVTTSSPGGLTSSTWRCGPLVKVKVVVRFHR